MKTYVVKDTIINLETLETQVYYTGKDGYVHDFPKYAEGYTAVHFASKKIAKEIASLTKIDDANCLEGGKWLHHYEIVEVEK